MNNSVNSSYKPIYKPFNDYNKPKLADMSNLYQKPNYYNKEPQNNNNVEDRPIPTKGFCQWCNFGKFYRATEENPRPERITFYDIANKGEHQYLKWLLKVNQNPQKWKFKINETCLPHIKTALLTNNTPILWKQEIAPNMDEEGKVIDDGTSTIIYVCDLNGKELKSPCIVMRSCMNCSRSRNELGMTKTDQGYLCKYCNDQLKK